MSVLTFRIYCCAIFFLLVTAGESLRCRSGNQQSNDQVHRIMQTCRKKHSLNGNKHGNDYATSSENDSSDENSDSSVSLEEELFFGNNKRSSSNSLRNSGNNGQSTNTNYGENRRNERHRQDSNVNNRMSNPTNYTWSNGRGNGMSSQNENRNYRSGTQSQNSENSNNNRRNRTECVTQCFFEELNLVDQRGFPERGYVTEIMTRGIQDPSVRDFIEESIFECFHYLETDTNNHEKCAFSNNLMNCFADKGRDRCEDWDDQQK